MLKNILKILMVFVCGAIGGIWAQIFLLSYLVEQPFTQEFQFVKQFKERETVVNPIEEIIIQENTALKKTVERVKKTVVGIKSRTKAGKVLSGSGLIASSDGLVVTLADIVPLGAEISLFLDNKEMAVEILQRKSDLALLKIEETNLSTVSFAELEKMRLGEKVFLAGVIFRRQEEGGDIALKMVNEGIVKYYNDDLIHTNMFENYELLGSSLFNIKGNLIGINTIDREGKVTAIPVTKIQKFLGF